MNKYTKYGLIFGILFVAVLFLAYYINYGIGYIMGYSMAMLGLPEMPLASLIISYAIVVLIFMLVGYLIGRSKSKS
ncbi:hypothetical protein KY338_04380 [Candidatus Woesearchaeota archaeon]|nr:hypothetical protein [Candidatus Woesearchaeota archaeon]MBW3005781.1 hypothetical protein [Candidatus Woesearchaeota archaeon]